MFKVNEDGQEGTCAANWGTIVGWKAASVAEACSNSSWMSD